MRLFAPSIRNSLRCLPLLALAWVLAPLGGLAAGAYYIDFQVKGYKGAEPMANVPVLVRLSPAIHNFSYDKCRPNGEDIAFTLPDGTRLDREVDTWDPEGESLVWVCLPELRAGMTFRCTFNDPAIVDHPLCQTDGSVWKKAGYAGVWHFKEGQGTVSDATSNGLDAVPMKAVENSIAVPGVIGSARRNATDADGYLSIPSYDELALGGRFTMSGWFYADSAVGYMRLFSRKNSWTEGAGWEIEMVGGSYESLNARGAGSTSIRGTFKTSMKKTWKHLAFVYDDAKLTIYENGEQVQSGAISPATDNGKPLSIGDNSNGSEAHFRGVVDECRLGASPASADRVKVEYAAVSDLDFLVAGDAVPYSGGLVIKGTPGNYGTAVPPYGISVGHVDGEEIPCSVSAVTTNREEGVIATCAGWKVYDVADNVLESGTGNGHTIVFESLRYIEWAFDRQFLIDMRAEGGGSIEGASPWEPEGKVLTLTAVADDGRQFLRWSGDFPCVGSREPTVVFTNDRPVSVVAVFRDREPVRYHVAPSGDDEKNMGLSPETPFQTPEMALSCMKDGDSLLLAPGRYVVREGLAVRKGLLIEGTPGSGEAILTRESDIVTNILTVAHSNALVRGIVVDGNGAKDSWTKPWRAGVAILKEGGALEKCVIRNVITGNNITEGAGIHMAAGLVRDCVITNNQAESSGGGGAKGGGVCIRGGVVERCLINGNRSVDGGGAYGGGVAIYGNGVLRNSLVSGNIARCNGSGVWMNGGLVENCTIAGNRHSAKYDTVDCAGLFIYWGGTIRNTVVYDNWNTGGMLNIRNDYKNNSFEHCCSDLFPESKGGFGNVEANPQFVDSAAGDYRLASGRCIDAGTNQTWMTETATDLDGAKRIAGKCVDIGCYEFTPTKLACSFDVTSASGLGSVEASFAGHVAGTNLTGLVYTWDFGDGSEPVTGADKSEVVHAFRPGTFSVTLEVTNGKETAFSVWRDCVKVAPLTAYVVESNPAARVPYDTWEIAATNVHDALSVCQAGSAIVISNGVYASTEPIQLFESIVLRSLNGPEVTTLKVVHPEGTTSRDLPRAHVVYATDPGAVVDGFTITGSGLAALMFTKGGTIENCIVRDNKTINITDQGSGINMAGKGIIRRCRILNNYTKCSGGAGAKGGGVYIKDGVLVDSCEIVSNRVDSGTYCFGGGIAAFGSTVRNCLIAWNTSWHEAGGAYLYGGTIENCTIVSNKSMIASGDKCGWTGDLGASGISLYEGATARNLVIHGNSFTDDSLRQGGSQGTDLTKNLFFDCLVSNAAELRGERNFAADPLFLEPSRGLFHLRSSSPARNRGQNAEWMETATDLDGNKRVFQRVVDLGCYENVAESGTMLILR